MKINKNKKISLIVFAIISGLLFASFILYNRNIPFEQTEIISISLTVIIVVIISIIFFKKMKKQKNDSEEIF
jgi:hypothetical protein